MAERSGADSLRSLPPPRHPLRCTVVYGHTWPLLSDLYAAVRSGGGDEGGGGATTVTSSDSSYTSTCTRALAHGHTLRQLTAQFIAPLSARRSALGQPIAAPLYRYRHRTTGTHLPGLSTAHAD